MDDQKGARIRLSRRRPMWWVKAQAIVANCVVLHVLLHHVLLLNNSFTDFALLTGVAHSKNGVVIASTPIGSDKFATEFFQQQIQHVLA
jgi:hypothetical protein